ncbi:MAG: hypothetical protein ACP5NW_03055 [Candidatus Woesearchaeota archaeon]
MGNNIKKTSKGLSDIVLVDSKNLSPRAVRALSERVAVETSKLDNLGIVSYTVFASINLYQQTERFSVKILATASGKTFVSERSSEYGGIPELYAGANCKLRKDILSHREYLKDHKRT